LRNRRAEILFPARVCRNEAGFDRRPAFINDVALERQNGVARRRFLPISLKSAVGQAGGGSAFGDEHPLTVKTTKKI
jgi:hypothetical protein